MNLNVSCGPYLGHYKAEYPKFSQQKEQELIKEYLRTGNKDIRDVLIIGTVPYFSKLIKQTAGALLNKYELDEILHEILIKIYINFDGVKHVTTRIASFFRLSALQVLSNLAGRSYKVKGIELTNQDDWVFNSIELDENKGPLYEAIKVEEVDRFSQIAETWPKFYREKVYNFIDTENPRTCASIMMKYKEPEKTKEQRAHVKKLNKETVLQIRKLIDTNKYTYKQIAEMYNVSRPTISKIKSKSIWSNV